MHDYKSRNGIGCRINIVCAFHIILQGLRVTWGCYDKKSKSLGSYSYTSLLREFESARSAGRKFTFFKPFHRAQRGENYVRRDAQSLLIVLQNYQWNLHDTDTTVVGSAKKRSVEFLEKLSPPDVRVPEQGGGDFSKFQCYGGS